ncbi:MAG: chromosome partitioning protein ParA [Alteromonadaceae bacterium]|nr:chromosome partitioning protein ParA [Alteromonadaceae bacterium]
MSYITLSNEIDSVYSKLLTEHKRSIAVVATTAGEGVTSMVLALARRILLSGQSVLVVDFNSHNPFFSSSICLPHFQQQDLPPRLLTDERHQLVMTGVRAPTSKSKLLHLRCPGKLEQQISQWLNDFDFVIFDTTPFGQVNQHNIPAQRVAAAVDSCILMVLSGVTTDVMVQESVNKLNKVDASILGVVINDKYMPTLQSELIREVMRLPDFWGKLRAAFVKVIRENKLLRMDV